jgi:hypothetical protein
VPTQTSGYKFTDASKYGLSSSSAAAKDTFEFLLILAHHLDGRNSGRSSDNVDALVSALNFEKTMTDEVNNSFSSIESEGKWLLKSMEKWRVVDLTCEQSPFASISRCATNS